MMGSKELHFAPLYWLLSISVLKKSAHAGTTSSFPELSIHRIDDSRFSHMTGYFLIVDGYAQ